MATDKHAAGVKIENLEPEVEELTPEEAERVEGGFQARSDIGQKLQFQLSEANGVYDSPPKPTGDGPVLTHETPHPR